MIEVKKMKEAIVSEEKMKKYRGMLYEVSNVVLVTILKERIDDEVREAWRDGIVEETVPKVLNIESDGVSVNNMNDSVKKSWPAKCSKCGLDTSVPFEPKYNSPIYCPECYKNKGERI